MATKWKYATIPASTRLDMLKEGNDDLYNEEIARTKDAISNRLAAGLDVSEQMKWADTVSYNHNLSKAKQMGIDKENVAKDGYSARLFGDMTESAGAEKVSTVKDPVSVEKKNYYSDYEQMDRDSVARSVADSYIAGINKRASLLSGEYKNYVKDIEKDYEDKLKKAYDAYRKNESLYEEKVLNSGHSENRGRSLTQKAKAREELYDYINAITSEKNSLKSKAYDDLKSKLYEMSSDAMRSISDEYYRYNSLLSDEEKSAYQKLRDGVEDDKWQKEFEAEKQKTAAEKTAKDRDYDLKKTESDRDFEKWQKEFEADNEYRDRVHSDNIRIDEEKLRADAANNSEKNKIDREELEYKKSLETAKEEDSGNEGATIDNSERKEYDEYYVNCLETVTRAGKLVEYDKLSGDYVRVYSDTDLVEWIKSTDLSVSEQKAICKKLGLNYK